MTLAQLREKVAKLASEQKLAIDQYPNHDFPADMLKELRERSDEIEASEGELKVLEENAAFAQKAAERDAHYNAPTPGHRQPTGDTTRTGEPGETKRFKPDGKPRLEDDQGWKSMGEFFMAVKAAGLPAGSRLDERLTTKSPTGMQEGIPSDGGFLVQSDFAMELLKRAYDTGQLASRAKKVPIGEGFNGLKMNAVDETSRRNGSRWGGIQAYWSGEADTVTATRPKFRPMELKLDKLMAIYYATDELLQDATALEALMTEAVGEEFGFLLDVGIFAGTGAGMPLGVMNSSALVTVNKEVGQSAATIYFENVVNMWSRMYARSRLNAAWFINQDIEPQLIGLSMVIGTGGVPVYLPPGGLSSLPYGSLFGRPVIPIEQASTLGTVGDINLFDLSQYLLIDKGAINQDMSIHVRFLYDESTFRFTYRTNGQPFWNSALTPYNGSNTQSPFITLQTRS